MSKAAVLRAARDVFARKGFNDATLREIAEVVGIKTPSLYAHVSSKEALYLEVYEQVSNEHTLYFDALVAATEPLSPIDRLHALLDGIGDYYHDRPDLAEFSLRAAIAEAAPASQDLRELFLTSEQGLIEAIDRAFQDGVDHGDIRAGDPASFSALFLVLMDGLFLQLTHYSPAVYRERADLAWKQFERLIRNDLAGSTDAH